MRVLFDDIIGGFLLTCAVGTALVLVVLWFTTGDDGRRLPAHHGQRARRAALLTTAWLLISAVLVIHSPWGPMTALYVLGIGGGLAIVATVLTITFEGARDLHRARTEPRRHS